MVLVPLTAACIAMAAGAYRLPEADLYAILAVEGGRVGQAVASGGGSSDLGPFQVNSRWGPALGRFWGVSAEDALSRLKNDGCANAVAATAILRGAITETGGDLTAAIGLYHSHTPTLSEAYRMKVEAVAKQLLESRK
jgi:hypothetical protein